jgi:hypothetical protein
MTNIIAWISSLIIPWTITYFIVAKRNGHVKLFEKNLGFCIVTSMLLFLVAFFVVISYLYETTEPSFLVPIMFAPIYVPSLWSFIVIVYSIQLKYKTILEDVLDD